MFARLLYAVLPPSVANELRHKREVKPKRFEDVTIMFSGVVNFTQASLNNVFKTKLPKNSVYINSLQ